MKKNKFKEWLKQYHIIDHLCYVRLKMKIRKKFYKHAKRIPIRIDEVIYATDGVLAHERYGRRDNNSINYAKLSIEEICMTDDEFEQHLEKIVVE